MISFDFVQMRIQALLQKQTIRNQIICQTVYKTCPWADKKKKDYKLKMEVSGYKYS